MVFNKLEAVDRPYDTVQRGQKWSQEDFVLDASEIVDLVGIWEGPNHIYILKKHPALSMLSKEELDREDDANENDAVGY